MKSRVLQSLLVASTVLFTSAQSALAEKEWTINERQDQLMKEINEAQKKNELTEKEAKKLRSRLADVARKEAKMRGKNNANKLTDANKAVLEEGLNVVSVDIKKLALEKRVDVAKAKAEAEKASQKEEKKKSTK